ncbi:hypothetical protein BJV77DRAFT_952059 [Russula vinacea]|nr:hypothetical protein BJV77DRAFT_952059 [Russula vinacea]
MDNTLVEDTAPQIWSMCLSHADKFDRALVETWKGDMDGILIFSGLFSAVVTAFLIISYPGLQPDVPTINAQLTARVATILANPTNQSNLSDIVTSQLVAQLPAPNSPTAYFIINALWFLSLAFSLSCALAATLVQQWSRTYLQGTEEPFKPRQRVRMRTFLQGGVQKFHFSELVDAIPMLLHIALFLFLSGLIVFLYNIKTALAHIMLVFSILALFIYVLLTSLPVSSMTAHTRHHLRSSCHTSLMP